MRERHIFFSVVIPLYNKEATIERALFSVLNQSIQDFEVIVVNDGSTDNGPNVVQSFDDPRILMIHQDNQGVSAARNRGIAEAKHDLIAFLDADDVWLPGFLKAIQQLITNYPHCAVYGTGYFFGQRNGRISRIIVRGLEDNFTGVLENYFQIAIKSDPPIHSSSIVVTKSAIKTIGGFPLGIKSGEDLLTWARLASSYPIAYFYKPLSVFILKNSLAVPARPPDEKDEVGKGLRMILNQNPEMPFLKEYIAIWYKIRVSQFLQVGCREESLKELRMMRQFQQPNAVFCLYFIIALMPRVISGKLYSVLCAVKIARRKLINFIERKDQSGLRV